VAILHKGRLIVRDSLESLKQRTKKLRAVYPDTIPESFDLEGLVRVSRDTHQVMLTVDAFKPAMSEQLRKAGAESVEVIDLSLEEIFVEAVKGGASHA